MLMSLIVCILSSCLAPIKADATLPSTGLSRLHSEKMIISTIDESYYIPFSIDNKFEVLIDDERHTLTNQTIHDGEPNENINQATILNSTVTSTETIFSIGTRAITPPLPGSMNDEDFYSMTVYHPSNITLFTYGNISFSLFYSPFFDYENLDFTKHYYDITSDVNLVYFDWDMTNTFAFSGKAGEYIIRMYYPNYSGGVHNYSFSSYYIINPSPSVYGEIDDGSNNYSWAMIEESIDNSFSINLTSYNPKEYTQYYLSNIIYYKERGNDLELNRLRQVFIDFEKIFNILCKEQNLTAEEKYGAWYSSLNILNNMNLIISLLGGGALNYTILSAEIILTIIEMVLDYMESYKVIINGAVSFPNMSSISIGNYSFSDFIDLQIQLNTIFDYLVNAHVPTDTYFVDIGETLEIKVYIKRSATCSLIGCKEKNQIYFSSSVYSGNTTSYNKFSTEFKDGYTYHNYSLGMLAPYSL